jgi:hypothetical protein
VEGSLIGITIDLIRSRAHPKLPRRNLDQPQALALPQIHVAGINPHLLAVHLPPRTLARKAGGGHRQGAQGQGWGFGCN